MGNNPGGQVVRLGHGPPVEVVQEMPDTPPLRNIVDWFKILGPATIALGISIGSGEWLFGPANALAAGTVVLWVVSVSATLQTIWNITMSRFAVYLGEPFAVATTRLWPGPRFWTILWIIVAWLQLSWPGWAFAGATTLAVWYLGGRALGPGDVTIVVAWGIFTFLLCILILSVGRFIERSLEIANWVIVALTLAMLIAFAVAYVPAGVWASVFGGIFFAEAIRQGTLIPKGADPALLGALFGFAAMGGMGNLTLSNWYRDKGYGMGKLVGAIPALVGGAKVVLSPVGKLADPNNPINLARFKRWMRIITVDMWVIFWLGAILGMGLPTALAVAFQPPSPATWQGAAYQAQAFAERAGAIGMHLALFVGFLILFSTQLGVIDIFVRNFTDLTWRFEGVRRFFRNDVKWLYYTVLLIFAVWGIVLFSIAQLYGFRPLVYVTISANMANLIHVIGGIAAIIAVYKLLPPGYRPSIIVPLGIALFAALSGFFFVYFMAYQFFGVRLI